MEKDEQQIAQIIADLGTASEVEVQARTLKTLRTLRQELEQMEKRGLVQRRRGFFKHGYGDALELTPEGYKSVK